MSSLQDFLFLAKGEGHQSRIKDKFEGPTGAFVIYCNIPCVSVKPDNLRKSRNKYLIASYTQCIVVAFCFKCGFNVDSYFLDICDTKKRV